MVVARFLKNPDNLSLVTREDLVDGSWKAVKEDMLKSKRKMLRKELRVLEVLSEVGKGDKERMKAKYLGFIYSDHRSKLNQRDI